ncbi:MAG: 23S rRNA (cytidine(2498)-2'-O)-methyltransferase RlmM [Casimicrobiaceae bacterium]
MERCTALLLYCRAGFEGECAKEIVAVCAALDVAGFVRSNGGAGFVEFVPHDAAGVSRLRGGLRFDDLIFARQLIFVITWLRELPVGDRVDAVVPTIASIGSPFSTLWLETADTNEAKELAAFCRKFRVPLAAVLEKSNLLREKRLELPRLHLFFSGSTTVCIGLSFPQNSSQWPMGIPRLRLPPRAPSRSTLKLAEALQFWLTPEDEASLLHEGVAAVDLGAAPGGWTWQLVRRGVQVTAVDNGPLDPMLLETGMVEHVRDDGFRYRPRWPVGWMVCDIVEQPKRVAELVGVWMASGWCTHCIFNLKLPMKKRYDEIERCRDLMLARWDAAGIRCGLRFRHLYHDREEITGYAFRLGPARSSGRKKAPRQRDQV